MDERREEVAAKLALLRNHLGTQGAVRLRGTDWFSWATAGASNSVLLARETGVAEILVTPDGAWVLTDEIDAQRLMDEELPDNFRVFQSRWTEPEEREEFVRDHVGPCELWSDRPLEGERPIPYEMAQYKRQLMPTEIRRYRKIGQLAAEAVTEVMSQAEPTWTELELAGAGAEALWKRGLYPSLTLAAGRRRLQLYSHPTPTAEPLGDLAMLSFSARGFGLHANLTRFVSFGRLDEDTRQIHDTLREIEAEALQYCIPGSRLDQIYDTLKKAYQRRGYTDAIDVHHQGGLTGYRVREIVATPMMGHSLVRNEAVAWNPCLAGARSEDTFLVLGNEQTPHLENLTLSNDWPVVEVGGIKRPLVWER